MSAVLQVQDLAKTFRIGFFRKQVEAVRGVDFEVNEGEIFGLLGPNGAGKTTTIKMILRLIFPDRGTIRVFGMEAGKREAMRRIGYMPENPYVYQYLKPLEFLDLCGRLVGMPKKERRQKSDELLEKVGLAHAVERPIGRFSKGMMQRVGLAQALLHDPELLILDEPMSGLDPIGRKEIRDLLLEQRTKGKTLVFTSHILADVERLCDRVVILQRGKVAGSGAMSELLGGDTAKVDIELERTSEACRAALERSSASIEAHGEHVTVHVVGADACSAVLNIALEHEATVVSVTPHRETLEAFFIRDAGTATQ